jgi:hypothetical protein
MHRMRVAIIALVVGAGVVLSGLPAAAVTVQVGAVAPFTCPPRQSPGFCPGG